MNKNRYIIMQLFILIFLFSKLSALTDTYTSTAQKELEYLKEMSIFTVLDEPLTRKSKKVEAIVIKSSPTKLKRSYTKYKKSTKTFSYESFSTTKLLKLYKKMLISTNQLSKFKKEKLLNEITSRFSYFDKDIYSRLSIQNSKNDKYKQIEIVDMMIMEINR